jgi:hypothetical protein
MSMNEVTEKLASTLRDRWIEARKCLGKPLPLILHEEVYEHFGEWCKIVEANVYDKVENAEVVIENRSGERHQLEFKLLSWRTNVCHHRVAEEKL